jgi:hypothetical protein
MTNEQLFASYDSELVLKNQSSKGLYEARRVLNHFRDFLGEFPPSPELGKRFLAQFAEKNSNQVQVHPNYQQFLSWYGEKLGVKIRMPSNKIAVKSFLINSSPNLSYLKYP